MSTALANLFRIRKGTEQDLKSCLALERAAYTDPWRGHVFTYYTRCPKAFIWVAEAPDGAFAGMVMVSQRTHYGSIDNIAVVDAFKGLGLGRRLFLRATRHLRRQGADVISLQVRARNTAARSLYETQGFVPEKLQKAWYHSPKDDAILMRKRFKKTLKTKPEI